MWLLSQGSRIKVLSPNSLKEKHIVKLKRYLGTIGRQFCLCYAVKCYQISHRGVVIMIKLDNAKKLLKSTAKT